MIKDLQQWKEAPVDCMVLALYQLQAYYLNKVRRGIAGVGEYTLRECYSSLRSSVVEYIPSKSPEEIVTAIKEGTSVSTQECHVHVPGGDEDEAEPPADLTRKLSSHARACLLLESGMISFDPKLHVFTVKGSSGVPRVVTLFPKHTCSCPSTGECYHILAVQMSIGVEKEQKPSRRNLTQLRKNTRTKTDKKSGRKRPHPGDIKTDKGMSLCLVCVYYKTNIFMNHLYSISDDPPLSPPLSGLPEAVSLSGMCLL